MTIDFFKNFNLFHLSYALKTIFIIKFRFPAKTNILNCVHDTFLSKKSSGNQNQFKDQFPDSVFSKN